MSVEQTQASTLETVTKELLDFHKSKMLTIREPTIYHDREEILAEVKSKPKSMRFWRPKSFSNKMISFSEWETIYSKEYCDCINKPIMDTVGNVTSYVFNDSCNHKLECQVVTNRHQHFDNRNNNLIEMHSMELVAPTLERTYWEYNKTIKDHDFCYLKEAWTQFDQDGNGPAVIPSSNTSQVTDNEIIETIAKSVLITRAMAANNIESSYVGTFIFFLLLL